MTKFVLIEPCNFIDFPIGGQLSFAKQLLQAFGNELALVGYAHEGEPAGKWYKKEIAGFSVDYFGLHHIKKTDSKPLIPLRIQNLFWFKFHIKKILRFPNPLWFIQAPEIQVIAAKYKTSGICYMFPGVTNPLEDPRYKWGLIVASAFHKWFLKSLAKTDEMLACADDKAIKKLVSETGELLLNRKIHHFPTCYDSEIFFPVKRESARTQLGIAQDKTVIVCNGRINKVKGWQLILDSFIEYKKKNKNSLLIFIGDGEDNNALSDQIRNKGQHKSVSITGFRTPSQVALYLNSSDLVVVGSEKEGWSVAMLEALGCGKPIVSTQVSGANTLISDGENGFVVNGRDKYKFAEKMELALSLAHSEETSVAFAKKYTIANLKGNLENIWYKKND